MTMSRIAIKCKEENKVIGHLQVPTGTKFKISAREFWQNFRPVTNQWMLDPVRQNDGEQFFCPRCSGVTHIDGISELRLKSKNPPNGPRPASVNRDQIRAAIHNVHNGDELVDSASDGKDTIGITFGRTEVIVDQ